MSSCAKIVAVIGDCYVANFVHKHLVQAKGTWLVLTMFAMATAAVTFALRTSIPEVRSPSKHASSSVLPVKKKSKGFDLKSTRLRDWPFHFKILFRVFSHILSIT